MRKLSFILYGLCLLFVVGCKTDKQMTDTSSVDTLQETVESETVSQDSKKQSETTTENNWKKYLDINKLHIEFNPGGTFNINTGDATNVSSIDDERKTEQYEKKLKEANSIIETQNTCIQMLKDSINKIYQQNNLNISEKKEVKTNWYMWFLFGVVAGVVLIIVLKKCPYTRWFMLWL